LRLGDDSLELVEVVRFERVGWVGLLGAKPGGEVENGAWWAGEGHTVSAAHVAGAEVRSVDLDS
jgi:hypothetical protein